MKTAVVGSGMNGFGYVLGVANQFQTAANAIKASIQEGRLNAADGPEVWNQVRSELVANIGELQIFEKSALLGAGLPYDPEMTGPEHLLNVRAASLNLAGIRLDKWMEDEANVQTIRKQINKIYDTRLEEKFNKFFGKSYDPKATYEGKEKELCDSYAKLRGVAEHYIARPDRALTFYPRIFFGIQNLTIFSEALDVLRSNGVTVIERGQSDVFSLIPENYNPAASTDPEAKLVLQWKSLKQSESAGAAAASPLESETFNRVILASGRWFDKAPKSLPGYIPDIWPIESLTRQLDEIIDAEIAKRKQQPSPNPDINIAIEGTSLSAMDIAKTILLESADSETLTFASQKREGFNIKLDLISRSGLMQKVKGNVTRENNGFLKHEIFEVNQVEAAASSSQPQAKKYAYPEGMIINQRTVEDLASANSPKGEIRLWQLAAIFARAMEISYRHIAQIPSHSSAEEMAANNAKADRAHDFLNLILANVKKDEAGMEIFSDQKQMQKVFDELSGDPVTQLKTLEQKLHLQLDGAKYEPIMNAFAELFGRDLAAQIGGPIALAKQDLDLAKKGEFNNLLVWSAFAGMVDELNLRPYLIAEEQAFFFNIFDRFLGAAANGMTQEAAEVFIKLAEEGALDIIPIGRNAEFAQTENGNFKYVRKAEAAAAQTPVIDKEYCAIINTRGHSPDMRKNPNPLFVSAEQTKLVTEIPLKPCSMDEKARQESFGEYAKEMSSHLKGDVYRCGFLEKQGYRPSNAGVVTNQNLFLSIGSGIPAAVANGKKLAKMNFEGEKVAAKYIAAASKPQPAPQQLVATSLSEQSSKDLRTKL